MSVMELRIATVADIDAMHVIRLAVTETRLTDLSRVTTAKYREMLVSEEGAGALKTTPVSSSASELGMRSAEVYGLCSCARAASDAALAERCMTRWSPGYSPRMSAPSG